MKISNPIYAHRNNFIDNSGKMGRKEKMIIFSGLNGHKFGTLHYSRIQNDVQKILNSIYMKVSII